MPNRKLTFAVFAAVCVVGAVVTAAFAVIGAGNQRAASTRAVADARPRADQILAGDAPFVVFRSVDKAKASSYGQLSIAALDGTQPGPAVPAGPSCARVAFDAGKGLCLDTLGTHISVKVLDAKIQVSNDFRLAGIPSRARVSPDGRWGGVTAFVVGHAYAAPGQFSTQTTLIDLAAGKPVADVEKDFTVMHEGQEVTARDRNFWGLTFADDGDTFYATMASGDKTWLIEGSIRDRRATTIHENVECPSLSPDGTRIGYKKAVGQDPTRWRFHVLDLATGAETALSETRSIDDQLSWLDDQHLLYGHEETTWVLDADGSGEPRRWIASADSPTIERGAVADVE